MAKDRTGNPNNVYMSQAPTPPKKERDAYWMQLGALIALILCTLFFAPIIVTALAALALVVTSFRLYWLTKHTIHKALAFASIVPLLIAGVGVAMQVFQL